MLHRVNKNIVRLALFGGYGLRRYLVMLAVVLY